MIKYLLRIDSLILMSMGPPEKDRYFISCLYDHIDENFLKGNKAVHLRVSNLIDRGIVKGLEIDDRMFLMKGPYAKLNERLIVLQAGFMFYLWTVCYFMIGLIEIYQDKVQSAKPVVSLIDSEKFELLNNTFAWGRSLKLETIDEFTAWPEHIANPTLADTRSRQANHLMVLAKIYLMCHELGHLVLHAGA